MSAFPPIQSAIISMMHFRLTIACLSVWLLSTHCGAVEESLGLKRGHDGLIFSSITLTLFSHPQPRMFEALSSAPEDAGLADATSSSLAPKRLRVNPEGQSLSKPDAERVEESRGLKRGHDSLSSAPPDTGLADATSSSLAPKRLKVDSRDQLPSKPNTENHSIPASERGSVTESPDHSKPDAEEHVAFKAEKDMYLHLPNHPMTDSYAYMTTTRSDPSDDYIEQNAAFGRLLGELDEKVHGSRNDFTDRVKLEDQRMFEAPLLSVSRHLTADPTFSFDFLEQKQMHVRRQASTWPAIFSEKSEENQDLHQTEASKTRRTRFRYYYWHLMQSLIPGLRLPAGVSDTSLLMDADRQLRDVGSLVLDQLKQLLTGHDLHAEIMKVGGDEMNWINTWKYAFKVVDLLSHNHFVDQRKLESFSQDQELAKLVVVSYINLFWKRTTAAESEAEKETVSSRDGLYRRRNSEIRTIIEESYPKERVGIRSLLRAISSFSTIAESLLSSFPHRDKSLPDQAYTSEPHFFTPGHDDRDEPFWNFQRLSLQARVSEELMEYLKEGDSWSSEIQKVIQLESKFSELLVYKNTILKTFDDVEKTLDDKESIPKKRRIPAIRIGNRVSISRSEPSKVSQSGPLVRACQERTEILMKLSLLKLGGHDSGEQYWGLMKSLLPHLELPADLSNEGSRLKAEEQLENVAAAILIQVRQLLLITSSGLREELSKWSSSSMSWYFTYSYAFTTADLLSENGFIDLTRLQSFLREQQMAKIAIEYVDEGWSWIWWVSGQLERGPWPRLNTSFKALDEDTRRTIEDKFYKKHAHRFDLAKKTPIILRPRRQNTRSGAWRDKRGGAKRRRGQTSFDAMQRKRRGTASRAQEEQEGTSSESLTMRTNRMTQGQTSRPPKQQKRDSEADSQSRPCSSSMDKGTSPHQNTLTTPISPPNDRNPSEAAPLSQ
ncbi:hypothetical protein PSTT_06706 [Puccinia striiformis]|uniref:Uncharacterized protein n=1 Tax=Puccinia striiformis TaxID=27350 RepID=A0A2S4VJ46_9BASI|nr:hypothetical protein PSTT_06706 [Puccinia striiformis]